MITLLITSLLVTCLNLSDNLFDGIDFNKQGIGYKTNIPVIYQEFGKAGNEDNIRKLEKNFKTTTALAFIYNDKEYYISIEEKNLPDFLSDLKEGDLILIDIVVFNAPNCHLTGRQNNDYCSYINRIQQKHTNSN